MRYRISRLAVHQTALVMALLYGLLALIFVPFVYLASRLNPDGGFPGYLIVILPALYALFGYILGAIGCWLYNVVAGWVGGIELVLDPHGNPTELPR